MSNYKISVITPFHNTDFGLFEHADKSMRNQTIGFENVQWIIIMHNCEKPYIDKVLSMYKNDKNVKVEILNNDKNTPGSPRNEAFKYIEAKYLIFLDSDDSFSNDCLEKVVNEMEETKSDMLRFRMEAIATNRSVEVISILAGGNATYERIICDKNDWNLDAMFAGYYGCCATQVYNVDFLKKNDLHFNEDQKVYEDLLFNAECITVADRVCILPQYIGYQYYQNSKSTVRSLDKNDEEIIEMAKGIANLFNRMTNYGASINFYIYGLIGEILCNFIAYSKKVTIEGRRKVKDILGSYVDALEIIPESKFYNMEKILYLYNKIKTIILFPDNPLLNANNAELNGIFALMSIVKKNANTDFGKRYHFSSLQNEKAYMNQVPISDELIYEPYIDLMYRVAEKNIILDKNEKYYYIQSDNDTLYPASQSFMQDLMLSFLDEVNDYNNLCLIRFYDTKVVGADNIYMNTIESLLLKIYSMYKIFMTDGKTLKIDNGLKNLYNYSGDESVYEKLFVIAIANEDINQIVAMNADRIYDVFQKFESNYEEYIDRAKCSDERKKELKKICESGFEGIAKKIWPKLIRVVAFGCDIYKNSYKNLKKYIKGVAYNHGSYFTEKGIIGTAIADDSDIFEMHKGQYFIELLEETERSGKTVLPTDAVVDKKYEIIMTNESGLYRYRTNIYIKPVEVELAKFNFRFC